MKDYTREYPLFSLCGLNCGLCPRYHSAGTSACPGCGGEGFYEKHPSCAVITCAKKHGNAAYCFQCESYPCGRFESPKDQDSFITYRHVLSDLKKAKEGGMDRYKLELDAKTEILEILLDRFNDGRKKSFYCLAANLLELEDLEDIREKADGLDETIPQKERVGQAEAWIHERAKVRGIDLKLRK
jgi:hypothetical protein